MDININDHSNKPVAVMLIKKTIQIPVIIDEYDDIMRNKAYLTESVITTTDQETAENIRKFYMLLEDAGWNMYKSFRNNLENFRLIEDDFRKKHENNPVIFQLFCTELNVAIVNRYGSYDEFETELKVWLQEHNRQSYINFLRHLKRMIRGKWFYNSPLLIPLVDIIGKHLQLKSYRKVIYMIQQCSKRKKFQSAFKQSKTGETTPV